MEVTETDDQAQDVQMQVLRTLGPEQRSLLAAAWSDALRATAIQGIRDRHPDFDDQRVLLEFARIALGEALFRRAFGAEAIEPK